MKGNHAWMLYINQYKDDHTVKNCVPNTTEKMTFPIKDFARVCEQIHSSSHLLRKSLRENFIFCSGQKLVCPWK